MTITDDGIRGLLTPNQPALIRHDNKFLLDERSIGPRARGGEHGPGAHARVPPVWADCTFDPRP